MPHFEYLKESPVNKSFRTAAVCGKFDFQNSKIVEKFIGDIPIEDKKWNIGVIVGNSGTGKSTIA